MNKFQRAMIVAFLEVQFENEAENAQFLELTLLLIFISVQEK